MYWYFLFGNILRQNTGKPVYGSMRSGNFLLLTVAELQNQYVRQDDCAKTEEPPAHQDAMTLVQLHSPHGVMIWIVLLTELIAVAEARTCCSSNTLSIKEALNLEYHNVALIVN